MTDKQTPDPTQPATPKAKAARAKPSKPKPPERPKNLPHGRWLGDFEPLSDAERDLVACCARGEVWDARGWDGEKSKRPTEGNARNTIRADIIRFLMLGGDPYHPVHEEGVTAFGAWVTGTLNLVQAQCKVGLMLSYCHLVEEPIFTVARLPELILSGSYMPGLNGDRLVVTGGLFLRNNFHATGEVRLLGAAIGSNLDCSGGRFENPSGEALNVEGVSIQGALFMRDAKFIGTVNLATGKIGTMTDDKASWQNGRHVLDGLHYDRIIGFTDAESRIAWLNRQQEYELNDDFKPQPWEQLIKVLREMGHTSDAAEVALEKQYAMRRAKKIGNRQPRTHLWAESRWPWGRKPLEVGWTFAINMLTKAWHYFYGALAGFGHRPGRLLLWMFGLWFTSALCFSTAASTGLLAPTDGQVIMHRQLHHDLAEVETPINRHADLCGVRHEVVAPNYWPACPNLPSEYTTFNPWIYSADVILPLVDLQQETDWAPAASFIDATGQSHALFEGGLARALLWFEILFGWFASLMFVAIVGRLVEKD